MMIEKASLKNTGRALREVMKRAVETAATAGQFSLSGE
jgi:hypothetical protein